MIVDDPVPHRRLGVERLAVLVVDHLGRRPADLRAVIGPTRLLWRAYTGACSRWRSTANTDGARPRYPTDTWRTSL